MDEMKDDDAFRCNSVTRLLDPVLHSVISQFPVVDDDC